MTIYPASAEEKLGFDVLRARLDELVRSRLGQERLERMRPASTLDWLQGELQRVAELQEAYRFDDPVPLDVILDVREVLRRAAPEESFVAPDDLLAVGHVLRTTRLLGAYVATRARKYPALAEATQSITALQSIEAHIERTVDPEGRVRDDASPELRRLRRTILQRQSELRDTLQRALREAIGAGYATEEQPTIRGGRMVIPVRAEAKRKVPGFVQDVSASGQTVYIEPASVVDLNNEIRELEAEERREVERILRVVTAEIRQHLDAVRENVRVLSQFDLLQAKARLGNELDAVVPQLSDDGVLDIRAGRNPVLLLRFQKLGEDGGEERHVVPLDLKLGEAFRTLVITGPNAGGKTVAMKTAGLLTLMLSYGLSVPVDPLSRLSLFGRLVVDLGDEQNLEEDLSTFAAHVTNLKHMLRHADARTLVLIDEAGTGTDPAEGGALAQAVLEHLTTVGARTIATTHHGTLKVYAHETEGVENGSMQFDHETLSPTYRFQPGVPGSSFAFEIAERIGLDRRILNRARDLVGTQKTALEDLITTFEARSQQLESRLQEAEATLRQAERERRTYEERAEKLRKERDDIRGQALQEAERIVKEANAQVERTIREIKEAEAEREATKAAREQLEQFKSSLAQRREKAERRRRERAEKPSEPTARDLAREAKAPKRKKPERNGRRPAEPPPPITGPIGVGDQVVLDGGQTVGEVLEIEGQEATVALGQMRMRAKLARLTKVGGKRQQQVTIRQTAGGGTDLAATRARMKVDLRGQRVDEALGEVERFLDEALGASLGRVEILHGKGTGALRDAIRDYLGTRPDVADFDDAPVDQGGAGITIVELA